MKNVFPTTKLAWVPLVLFPFKFYIPLFPLVFIVLMIWGGTTHIDRLPMVLIEDQIHLMIVGYVFCIIVLTIGGIFTAILMRNWKLMLPGLIYAGIGLFLWSFLILPILAPSR
jgi:hypothetical protein